MKTNYIPPKGVTQLTYNVSRRMISRLALFNQTSKSIDGYIPLKVSIEVKCGKQSDFNYKKWDSDLTSTYILNFNYKGIHVYMKLKDMVKMYNKEVGIYYKILAHTIKELPK